MKDRILAAALTTLSLLPGLCAEEPQTQPINPALLYWQAAAQLPKLNDKQAQELRDMASGKLPVDTAKVEKLGFAPAEGCLKKAAASSAPCDWGVSKEEGPWLVLPHLPKVMELARVAAVEAEANLAQGKTKAGIEWLLTVHRIARHSGAGDTLLMYLVQSSIETLALRSVARHCLAWDEGNRRGYSEKLKSFPPLHSLPDAYRGELSTADWLERQLDLPEPERGEKLKLLYSMGCGPSENLSQADGEKYLGQFKPEPMKKLIAEYRALNDRTQRAACNPWKVGRPELDALLDAAKKSEFIIIRQSYPALASVFDKEFVLRTMRTMLDAALQYGAQIDEAKAATYQDAFEGKPLRLERSTDGTLSLVGAEKHPAGKLIELKLGK